MNPGAIGLPATTGNGDVIAVHSLEREYVMGLFEELNAEGRTIVVVTHDPDIAARAARRIVLRDGRIASDDRRRETAVRQAS